MSQTFSNVLMVRLSAVGDVAFALPALECLRHAWPDARISWLVEDRAASLLENHPCLDEVIIVPRRKWRAARAEGGSRLAVGREMLAFRRSLASREFDLAIDFQGNLKSGFFTSGTRAPVRVGFSRRETREPNWLFTNRRLDLDGRTYHRVERDLLLLEAVGLPAVFQWPRVAWTSDAEEEIKRFCKKLHGHGPLVVLHPGTSTFGDHKRWPAPRYGELADALIEQHDARIVMHHGPGEESLIAEVLDASSHELEVMPVLDDLRSVACIMSLADVVVGADTGPVHLAALHRTPTVALFGPYDPRHYYPYQHSALALYDRVPCSPCRYRDCQSRVCMSRLDTGKVLAAVRAAISAETLPHGPVTPLKTVSL